MRNSDQSERIIWMSAPKPRREIVPQLQHNIGNTSVFNAEY
jgi:hypothetical protein